MQRKQDRRVQRTRQLLRSALLSLIREKGFEALSVQDIIDRADVGRATFYAHFDNKEDLLLSGFEELKAALRQRQSEAQSRATSDDDRALAFSHHMFSHAAEHRDLYEAMVGKRSGALVERILHKLLLDLVREELKGAARNAGREPAELEGLVHFIAGGLFGMLMWWLREKRALPVEELNAMFRRYTMPALGAVRR